VANEANYLACMFGEGLEYATLNGYRPAISTYHPEVGGYKIGQLPVIRNLMMRVFNQRPPTPRYQETWDVGKLLQFIDYLGENENLTDKMLSGKLVALLALTNVGRAHEIQSSNPGRMQDFGDKLVSRIAKLTKVKRPGKAQIVYN
jgi:hypothetical protein